MLFYLLFYTDLGKRLEVVGPEKIANLSFTSIHTAFLSLCFNSFKPISAVDKIRVIYTLNFSIYWSVSPNSSFILNIYTRYIKYDRQGLFCNFFLLKFLYVLMIFRL